ncbi:MAG: ferrochelatase [Actinomycetota bacterium]|jgi:protoheme ferro-lyase|nr:ferrochelatase [Actinomycetota bacterium]
MATLAWMALTIGALVVGVATVGALAAPKNLEFKAAILAMVALAVTTWGSAAVVDAYERVDVAIYATIFALAAFVGGYGLASSLLGGLMRGSSEISLPSPLPDEVPGTVALFVSCAEPETYDPRMTAADLEEIAEEDGPARSASLTPFLYAAQKARYRAIGGKSPASHEVLAITDRVRDLLDHNEYPIVKAVWCVGDNSLDAAVSDAASQGYRRIVIVGISVAEAFHIDKAKCSVDALKPHLAGLQIGYAPPLWASEELARLVSSRILGATENLSETGVALVAHGQPESREQSHHAFDAQEQSFVNRVRMLLLEGGLEAHLVRTAWADWRDPDITETVRHLAALGATKILLTPACHPVNNVSTMLDFPLAANLSRVDPPVRIVQMRAWGDEPRVAEALATAVHETQRELDK